MGNTAVGLVSTHSPSLVALARSLDRVADGIAEGDLLDMAQLEIDAPPDGDDVAEIVAAAERLVAAVRRSHALEDAVHEIFAAMSSHLRLDYLSDEALYRLIDHTQAVGGAIVLVEDGPPDIVASVDFEMDGERLADIMASVHTKPGPSQLDVPENTPPVVTVPFVGDSGPLGAVLLMGVELDGEMRRLLALLARALGFAVSNALALAAAETQATTDPLTGCNNRRAGLEALAQAVRVAAHAGPSVGALMVDLDVLTHVNDRHGHQIGDEVLRAAGRAIAAGMRGGDVVTRYAGEEFLVMIAGANESALTRLAERISARVRALKVPDGTGGTVALTTSVGVAVWTPSDTVETLIGRAEVALDAAKDAGRDRVVLREAPEDAAIG
jgi:diguanylate cyclase (GGDEF)-like protein